MVRSYWKRVHLRAWKEARQALWLESSERAVIIVVLSALVIALIWLIGGKEEAISELIAKGSATAAILLAFPIVYWWKFFRVPPIHEKEAAEVNNVTIGNLTNTVEKLTEQRMRRYDVLVLSVLLEKGNDLCVKRIKQEDFETWAKDVKNWLNITMAYLATKFSHQDAVAFGTVTFNPKQNFIFKISDQHNSDLNELSARIEVAKKIIARHEDIWSPLTIEERKGIEAFISVIERQAAASNGN
jgi:hypothetical protein